MQNEGFFLGIGTEFFAWNKWGSQFLRHTQVADVPTENIKTKPVTFHLSVILFVGAVPFPFLALISEK